MNREGHPETLVPAVRSDGQQRMGCSHRVVDRRFGNGEHRRNCPVLGRQAANGLQTRALARAGTGRHERSCRGAETPASAALGHTSRMRRHGGGLTAV
jgi:hypothetical protein